MQKLKAELSVPDLLVIVGLILLVIGLAMLSVAVALVVLGVLLMGCGLASYWLTRRGDDKDKPVEGESDGDRGTDSGS